MKAFKIQNLLLSLLCIGLFSCSTRVHEESELGESILKEGEEFSLDISVALPHELTLTRSGLEDLHTLKLMIFDENNKFLYSRNAILKTIVDLDADDSLHPEGADRPAQVYTYSAKLFSSFYKRSIHYIANYKEEIEQDYFIEGLDAGQVIASLTSQELCYWNVQEFKQLTAQTASQKTVLLLPNQAQIKLENEVADFELHGFALHNYYDRGTLAPFVWDEDQMGSFPTQVEQPTIPADARLQQDLHFSKGARTVFEHDNQGDQALSLVIKGRFRGAAKDSYYRIALKRNDLAQGQPVVSAILRNQDYRITLKNIKAGSGYDTAEEALAHPAGNNIYASVELEQYNKVSDGTQLLEVDKLAGILVKADQVFQTQVHYSRGIQGFLKVYPSWDSQSDPYLGALEFQVDPSDPTRASIKVKPKQIPSDRYLYYYIDVVGQTEQGIYMSRRIKILVRQPYRLGAKLVKQGGDKYSLSFELPATLDENLLPFDLLIETHEMMPSKDNKLILIYQAGTYYYKYSVNDSALLGKRINLAFDKVSRPTEPKVNVTILGDYFEQETLRQS